MRGIKEQIENNPVIWMLGILLAGFLAGIGTYEAALKIMKLDTVSVDRLKTLEQGFAMQGMPAAPTQEPLPSYIDKKEVANLFGKAKQAFNENSVSKLYSMLGPIARAQISEESATSQITSFFSILGKIESGLYVQPNFLGKQGLYKSFMLNFFAKYEKAERGVVTIGILDDGTSFQIYTMSFNSM